MCVWVWVYVKRTCFVLVERFKGKEEGFVSILFALDGGLLEFLGVDLEDAGEDDVVEHEEGDDEEGGEDEDVEGVVLVVGLWGWVGGCERERG